LVRPVEDIVFLIPWSEIAARDEEGIHLATPRHDFPAETATDKIMARRDILNKQIVDTDGNRLQRVDNVVMRQEGVLLFLEGLQVGTEWLPAGGRMGKLVSKLRRRYNRPGETNIIPYEAILRVDEEALVIRT
jgi:sporulation protein YlmC with PRC-barrel domain